SAHLCDAGRVDRTLGAPVAAEVLIRAVAIAVAVRLIVLAFVAHQVVQREPVVRGDEVDAGVGSTAARLIEVARPREPRGQLRDLAEVATPESADRVAIFAVPFGPAHREVPHLIATAAEVPWLGDEL